VTKERWTADFKLETDKEVDALRRLLTSKLDKKLAHFRTQERRVILETTNEDAVFRTGQWLRYNNPLGQLLFYSVKGYDADGRVIFDSGCPVCRTARSDGHIRDVHHYAHRIAGKAEARMKLLGTCIVEDGVISLPRKVRSALKIRNQSELIFLERYGNIIIRQTENRPTKQ
jgi:hypothetical protein